MQEIPPYTNHGNPQSGTTPEHPTHLSGQPDDLTRIFNTAIVATRVESVRDFSAELFQLMEAPAYKAILTAVRQLARTQGVSEREAAESVIQTFRKVDQVWADYLSHEGVDRLKSHLPPG